MATIQSRPFSKNYSGLINQSVIGGCITVLCISAHEYMKRKRRGARKLHEPELDSVENWEFGYLYQGRSWARRPTPRHPERRWPLGWVKQVVTFPEDRMNELRGVDATVYTRFLKGCVWFTLAQSLTTLPVLLPIHVTFSDGSVSPQSMTRASISSLVTTAKGRSLLWIHLLLIIWVTVSWMLVLLWLCRGAFHLRAQNILSNVELAAEKGRELQPHPQYSFQPSFHADEEKTDISIRLRTVMVTNVPLSLRSEKEMKEYFEYYLSRQVARPALGITATMQPGFLNKIFSFLLNRLARLPAHLQHPHNNEEAAPVVSPIDLALGDTPVIDNVSVVRRMSELATLLGRREETLQLLETAHIKLARRALNVVKILSSDNPSGGISMKNLTRPLSRDTQDDRPSDEVFAGSTDHNQLLVRTLSPFLSDERTVNDLTGTHNKPRTVWNALLSLPRSSLDVFQPMMYLSTLFPGKTVPVIDYYTAKLEILSALITEKRAKAVNDYEPTSTAFVTFANPADARRACKYLAVHPANPLQCFVIMAPSYENLDWIRLMRSTFKVEFVKDWLINLVVWAFTVSWIFPVSIFVGLVSIQNISTLTPGFEAYLDEHPWEEELLQSFLPTVLVSLLSLLIAPILLLISKKAHTIATLSALHDKIMTRYYKFLIINVLIFFCVGTAALQSVLVSLSPSSGLQVIQVVADSFPTAGPFYVGWLIFTMAMHAGLEIALLGLPLILYPSLKRQITPRKRAIGIRPRTFNYYYWLPNHVLVINILLVFAVLNPLVIPFGFIYFCVTFAVIKNQLLHVYAKNYEGNGQNILIRIIRYSSDGLLLAQVVFMAYMVVLKKSVNVAISAVLIIFTVVAKLSLTRLCRARFERDDLLEAQLVCDTTDVVDPLLDAAQSPDSEKEKAFSSSEVEVRAVTVSQTLPSRIHPRKFPDRIDDGYATLPRRPYHRSTRKPNPFGARNPAGLGVTGEPAASTLGISTAVESREHASSALPSSSQFEPVTPHPLHPAWDDELSHHQTYDNPYYTRTIKDELWLPRDPTRLLNLDDTVDVHLSLTTQPGSGRLGALRPEEFLESGLSSILDTINTRSRGAAGASTVREHRVLRERTELPLEHSWHPKMGANRVKAHAIHHRESRRTWCYVSEGNSSDAATHMWNDNNYGKLRSLPFRPRIRSHGPPTPFIESINSPSSSLVPEATPRTSILRSPADLSQGSTGSVMTIREAVIEEVIAEERAAASTDLNNETVQATTTPLSLLASWIYGT